MFHVRTAVSELMSRQRFASRLEQCVRLMVQPNTFQSPRLKFRQVFCEWNSFIVIRLWFGSLKTCWEVVWGRYWPQYKCKCIFVLHIQRHKWYQVCRKLLSITLIKCSFFFAFLILLLDHKSQLTHCTCDLLTYFININNNNNNYMLYFLTKIFTIKKNYQYE